jgi:hypothetical protein
MLIMTGAGDGGNHLVDASAEQLCCSSTETPVSHLRYGQVKLGLNASGYREGGNCHQIKSQVVRAVICYAGSDSRKVKRQ